MASKKLWVPYHTADGELHYDPNAGSNIGVDTDDNLMKFRAPDLTVRQVVTNSDTQTLTGKTLTSPVITTPYITVPQMLFNILSVAAAGSTQGDAGTISGSNYPACVVVSGADATKGVVLPAAAGGMVFIVKNNAAAILKVYPASGAAINAIATDGAISMASLTAAVFFASSATQWFTVPLLPS